ncbi:glucosaminidase domain-containing protein [Candidatus Daviesbacteria bacterium]|nr:glucosaminidase domain-containing protein [Candidatus Daviesbacteria bacterium]
MQTDSGQVLNSSVLTVRSFPIPLIACWFGSVFLSFFFAILLFFYISTEQYALPTAQTFQPFAALPEESSETRDNVEFTDGRAKIIENYFKSKNSILADYSQHFLSVAEKYSLDYRLLPSIAMQESNGGKKVIKDSYNPFGFGIYGNKVTKFTSWEEAIERVGRALREDYLNQGLKTPRQIMAKYTPPSVEKGGAWAKGVSYFMEELQ